MYKYKVSVVMAVYNVEPFLREAVDSVLAQDIGFENVQLILVNDGSRDNSGSICDEYAAKYPNNIIAVHKENGGVSSARNTGLQHVKGQYVNFLDSDDKLSPDTLRLVCDFFREHENETDLVAIPLNFFDAQTGDHPLNNKFSKGTRVIDLRKEWQFAQLSFSCAFAKAECLEGLFFNTNLAYAEDAQLVQKILLRKQTMGVVAEAIYHYRSRSTGSASAIQTSGRNYAWYFPYLEHFQEHVAEHCLTVLGEVPLFVQNTLMYDLQWRFRQGHIPSDLFTEEEAEHYRQRLFALLSNIDDSVILVQKRLSVEQKIFLLQVKHPDTDPVAIFHHANQQMMLSINGSIVCDFSTFQFRMNFITLAADHLNIELSCMIPNTSLGIPKLYAIVNNQQIPAEENNYDEPIYSLGILIAVRKGFRITIPLTDEPAAVSYLFDYGSFQVVPKNLLLGKHCPITYKLSKSYYSNGNHILYPTRTGFRVAKFSKKDARKAEILLMKELAHRSDKPARNAFLARSILRFLRPLAPRNLWLITDKADRADDNGEAFFLYCAKNKRSLGCHPVFAVSKESNDYKRLKKFGRVIPYMSWRYKLYHLLAKHTISAYSHDETTSPFLDYTHYYCDLLQNNQIVFLQHGIIKDDLSQGLNRNHKNFSLFVTSTKPEYDSVLSCNYGYTDKHVILTGLPRYDRLYDNSKQKITVMPTWRRSLFGTYNPNTSQWTLLPGFEKSDFYCFYSSLLNSPKLHEAAEKYGYHLQFLVHPTLFPYLEHFQIDPRVTVLNQTAVYRDVFAESSLILTDYSSVAFDMAYLRKPVLYAHFDANHYAEGYFNYQTDGFGEVEADLDSTVNRIIEYMENGCQLKDIYRRRIDSFFAFDDSNSCRRVCEKILELDNEH